MKRPIRFPIWAWNTGVDDFAVFTLPSIMQPNNLPWVVRNGYPVALDFYTTERDRARIEKICESVYNELRAAGNDVQLTARIASVPDDGRSPEQIKSAFFEAGVRTALETGSHTLFLGAEMYFGDGSIRNIVVYGEKPRVTVGGLYLRVKQEPFSRLLARHQAVTGSATISNARLVDIGLDTMIDGLEASITDNPDNASYLTSSALRRISDDLYAYTAHVPTPVLYSFEQSDYTFFNRFRWNVHLTDHVWPAMLMAQNRWRMMGSSDLFFLLELNRAVVETGEHTYPTQPNLLYNDDVDQEHLHGRINQTMLMTLRRERLP
jgi:hypothetical protein